MHKDLVSAFGKVVDMLKCDERCKGGWHYGSFTRGEEDGYSDFDPVFLVEDRDFEAFAADAPKVLGGGLRRAGGILGRELQRRPFQKLLQHYPLGGKPASI